MKSVLTDKTKILLILIISALLCLGLIGLTAYSTSLQYDINALNNKIQDRQWAQRNLEVEIKSANTLANLEARAHELGLESPSFDEIVYLNTEDTTVHDFAQVLKETAYNR